MKRSRFELKWSTTETFDLRDIKSLIRDSHFDKLLGDDFRRF